MDEAYVGANIFVFAGKDDGKFGFVFNGGVDEVTSDANDAELIKEWIMGDERRIFHGHFLGRVWVENLLDLEIFPFLCKCYLLCGAKDGVFCVAEFGDGYGKIKTLFLLIFCDGDAQIAGGGGCPLIWMLIVLAAIFPPKGDYLF